MIPNPRKRINKDLSLDPVLRGLCEDVNCHEDAWRAVPYPSITANERTCKRLKYHKV